MDHNEMSFHSQMEEVVVHWTVIKGTRNTWTFKRNTRKLLKALDRK
jgi:hypothetical protein